MKASHEGQSKKRLIEEYCRRKGYEYDERTAKISIYGYDRTLAVWAYNLSIDVTVRHDTSNKPPYRIVHVPYATNPNISAQKGLFTILINPTLDGDKEVDRTSFDHALVEYFGTSKYPPDKIAFMTCFCTHHDQAFEILRLLAGMGVTAGTIFPGIAGASATVSERLWWWEKNDS